MISRVNRRPFSPPGEKVADRPDEGAFEDGRVLKRPPRFGPLAKSFARRLSSDATQHPQKHGGERATLRCPALQAVPPGGFTHTCGSTHVDFNKSAITASAVFRPLNIAPCIDEVSQ